MFSPREVEVLAWVAEGLTNREIGDALGLSVFTVKSHLARIGHKFSGVNEVRCGDRAHLVALALRAGIIS